MRTQTTVIHWLAKAEPGTYIWHTQREWVCNSMTLGQTYYYNKLLINLQLALSSKFKHLALIKLNALLCAAAALSIVRCSMDATM